MKLLEPDCFDQKRKKTFILATDLYRINSSNLLIISKRTSINWTEYYSLWKTQVIKFGGLIQCYWFVYKKKTPFKSFVLSLTFLVHFSSFRSGSNNLAALSASQTLFSFFHSRFQWLCFNCHWAGYLTFWIVSGYIIFFPVVTIICELAMLNVKETETVRLTIPN